MLISINNPIGQTWIFSLVFLVVLLLTTRRRKITDWFPASLTAELKGLAILMIVISHIGYFLATDHRFLWPLSIAAGVGVNLFLFLSGFGLTASQLKKRPATLAQPNSLATGARPGVGAGTGAGARIWEFYKKRLLKIFTPFWLMLIIFLALDFFILKINYSWDFLAKATVGIFTQADLYRDFNSPLWYLTLIIGYYLLFPLVFSRKRPWLSALILYVAGYLLIRWEPAPLDYVLHLYKLHILAFPLGVLAAWGISQLKNPEILERLSKGWRAVVYYLALAGLLALFVYANIHSGIGGSARQEELMSTLAIITIALVFVLKKREFRLLSLFGVYSYEIYLWHWPILYRYDLFYSWLPAWLATILYLGLFIGVGWAASKVVGLVSKKKEVR